MDKYLIYPKQFRRMNIPIEKNRCFVIMPFKKELDYIYGTIKKGLSENGYICNRVDEISGSTPIINKILSEILKSRYVIADLTDCNANVFYELGIAHSFKDAQNIIILKQKGSKVPFDITHLTYIEYENDNPKYLISTILKSIEECSLYTDFQEILNIKGIISFVNENTDYFIDYLQSELQNDITVLTRILSNEYLQMSEIEIELFFNRYENILQKAIKTQDDYVFEGILKVYYEMLISCSALSTIQLHVSNFLNGNFTSTFSTSESKIKIWQTDLAITLAKSNKMFSIVLPWIIRYFSETKTATIDLNRYKLEAFLMTSDHPTVNEMICNSVFDSNCYVREHISDIIGEKRLTQAVHNLCRQLVAEKNYYSAVSEIEALGKIGDTNAIEYILKWVTENEKEIISQKQFFVLKHIRIALLKLDSTSQTYIKTFDEKYVEFLKDYYIL